MDNQNNPGGSAPSEPVAPTTEPTPAPSEPVTTEPVTPEPIPAPMPQLVPGEKCVTCGGPALGGTCTACGQGEISCICQPAAPAV